MKMHWRVISLETHIAYLEFVNDDLQAGRLTNTETNDITMRFS